MQIGCGILAVWNDCAAGHEAEYEDWYLGQHLVERLSIPGFQWGRRYRRIQAASDTLPEYMTYYQVETPEVLSSDAYLARVNDPTPETHRVMTTIFQNMNRTICRRVVGSGSIRGGYAVVAVTSGDVELPLAGLAASRTSTSWREAWQSAEPSDQNVSEEEALRGRDAKISGCILMDCQTKADAVALALESAAHTAAQSSVYQLTGTLHAIDL